MNSYDKADYNDNRDCKPCRNHPRPGGALLRAGNGSLGPQTVNFITTTGVTPLTNIPVNQLIGSVTIDTACLNSPTLLVNFAGILTSTATALAGSTFFNYNFMLFKTCKGGVRQPLRSFNFSQPMNVTAIPFSSTLKLEYTSCDDVCDYCCVYSLELVNISGSNLPVGVTIPFTFSINGVLSVLAVESSS